PRNTPPLVPLQSAPHPRAPHPFPTRRSSDLDLVPGELDHARERVADRRVAAARDRQRSGRVSAHELDQDPLMLVRRDEAATEARSEEHTSELQSRSDLVCRLLLEKKKRTKPT